ncbi:AAA family ATPase [Alkalihalobacillus sp. 1P02AB]|uniref:AAA family ATPase n=1 Tax=Alkalihalobacillus sp. 1P02AB TaxID=3132260 RepID=UPI0039A74276
MNNILSVRLENFQSHLDTWIDFDKGLNVIVGQSDSGKTAIIRAIRWVLFNLPRGTDFVRVGANFVRVTIEFENGVTIIRERKSSKNRYIIKKANDEELILEGFGTQVPKEVLEAHGMFPLRVDRDNELHLHLAQQLDGPFLLEQTGSVRAKTIGRISGAHYLDMAIRDTSKDLSQLQQRKKHGQEEVEQLQHQLEPYQALNDSKEKINRVEAFMTQLKVKQDRLEKWKSLQAEYKEQQQEKAKMLRTKQLVSGALNWEVKLENIQIAMYRLKELKRKQQYVQETKTAIVVCKQWIEKTKHVQTVQDIFEKIMANVQKREQLGKFSSSYQQLKKEQQYSKERLQQTEFILNKKIQQLGQIHEQTRRLRQLSNLSIQKDDLYVELSSLKKQLQWLEKVEPLNEQLDFVHKKVAKMEILKQKRVQYEDLKNRIDKGRTFIEKTLLDLSKLEKEYEQALVNEGTCPLCGHEVNKEKIMTFLHE